MMYRSEFDLLFRVYIPFKQILAVEPIGVVRLKICPRLAATDWSYEEERSAGY